MVQVIRNEYVTNVPVRVLGDTGPERTSDHRSASRVRLADRVVVGSAPGRDAGPLRRRGAAIAGSRACLPIPRIGGAEAGITLPPAATGTAAHGRQPAAPRGPARSSRRFRPISPRHANRSETLRPGRRHRSEPLVRIRSIQ